MYLYDQEYHNYIYNYMYNYLIDTKIKIYENDTLSIKFQKILLKYKRIIAIVLLIILLIIGYQCDIYYIFINKKEKTCILHGGGSFEVSTTAPMPAAAAAFTFAPPAAAASAPASAPAAAAASAPAAAAAAPAAAAAASAAADAVKPKAKKGKLYKSKYASKIKAGAKNAAAATKSGIMNAPANLKAFGQRRAEDIKDLAPWFYGIIYSISIALLSFLIFMPTIGFIVVGIVCFALLKEKISYIKSL